MISFLRKKIFPLIIPCLKLIFLNIKYFCPRLSCCPAKNRHHNNLTLYIVTSCSGNISVDTIRVDHFLPEGLHMGKRSKSKRFVGQGKVSVAKHDERFTYHSTLAEAESKGK